MLAQIRKHGNSGKHLSGGERSMLSGFQEAAQKIEDRDEYALAPFYLFYDTVHTFLDSSIRRVIERCQRAADDGNGIEPQDVNVLKLLYLVRYVDDIKANLDNIVILMADDIRLEKITMREQVRDSLNRLLSQNYIGRTGDTYNFLTDEEQDIQREIKNTMVPNSEIIRSISQMIFADIYTAKKYRSGRYDFTFDQMVDSQPNGVLTGGMMLRILTAASDPVEKTEMRLVTESKGQALIVLADNPYYESLESAMKIRKYVKSRNVSQLPKSVQEIIRDQQTDAANYEIRATAFLAEAIAAGRFYVDGEAVDIRPGNVSVSETDPEKRDLKIKQAKAKSVIDQALEYLVSHVYSDLGLITKFAETEDDIVHLLRGFEIYNPGTEPNLDAAAKVEEFLEVQHNMNRNTTMDDVQKRYQAKPYGWREIDIAAVVAMLIQQQKVTIKYSGATIQPDNPKLVDMLRKKTEIGRTSISKRQTPSIQVIREVREFLRDFFDEMDVPEDEDGLIRHIKDRFGGELQHYSELLARYKERKYPDQSKVEKAIGLVKDVLSQQNDNIALLNRVKDRQDDLYDMKQDLQQVEEFFKSRVGLYDAAVLFEQSLRHDLDYIAKDPEANAALNRIRLITMVQFGVKYDYSRLPELNELMATVKDSHDAMLQEKRNELLEIVRQCLGDIHEAAAESIDARSVSNIADTFYGQKKDQIASTTELALLDGLIPPMWQYKDTTLEKIEIILNPPKAEQKPPVVPGPGPQPPKKIYKTIHRQAMFPAKILTTDEEIDAYVEKIRMNMKQLLKGCDGIKLS